MKTIVKLLAAGTILMSVASCNQQKTTILKQSDFPQPPIATLNPQTFTEFGNERVDNYYWLRDKTNPAVIDYLNAENAYTDTVMSSTKALQEKIYNEIMGRIKDADESYPLLIRGYKYYNRTESGKQYRVYCRKADKTDAAEEIIFDINAMAEGKKAMRFAGYSVSPDNKLAAYTFNETGSFADYILKVRNLETGEDFAENIPMVTSYEWANDNKTIFYVVVDKALRPHKVFRHTLGSTAKDVLIYEETDARFNLYLDKAKTDKEIFIVSSSSTTSEYRYIAADKPMDKPQVRLANKKSRQHLLLSIGLQFVFVSPM
jgi:oligopeptidase B